MTLIGCERELHGPEPSPEVAGQRPRERGRVDEELVEIGGVDLPHAAVVAQAKLRRYVSSDHFSVDGTLLEAWASHKSFQPKDGPSSLPPGRNAEVSVHGQRRSNQTHASRTDPEARMARKSNATAAKLSYAGHLVMEHRNALVVDIELSEATGYAERDTALEMLARLAATKRRRTVAGDKAYDTKDFVADLRGLGFTPHIAPNTTRQRSTIDGRTTRHPGHAASQWIRKRIEEPFGWIKTITGGRKLRYIGRARNRAWFLMTGAVYNTIRITDSTPPPPDRRRQPHQFTTPRNPDRPEVTPPNRSPVLKSRFSARC